MVVRSEAVHGVVRAERDDAPVGQRLLDAAPRHAVHVEDVAIHELLDLSDNIREMIVERRPGSEVRRAAEAEGLKSLRESALQKVFAGVSTLHEINRVTFVEEVTVSK